MANPLADEKEIYERIRAEKMVIARDIWQVIYYRLGDDLSAVNLLCEYYVTNNEPMPVEEIKKILVYTADIKDIISEITVASHEDVHFPKFKESVPLNPVIRHMFTHYIGNDVYMINLIVGDAIDPLFPQDLCVELTRKILEHTHAIKDFMDKLREATWQE